VEPHSRSVEEHAMPRGMLVGLLRGLADGLEAHPDADLHELVVAPVEETADV
jgi:hypothetical protein